MLAIHWLRKAVRKTIQKVRTKETGTYGFDATIELSRRQVVNALEKVIKRAKHYQENQHT